jgi:hypothetical protein
MGSATTTTKDQARRWYRLLQRSCEAHAMQAPVPSRGLVRCVARLRDCVSASGIVEREGLCAGAVHAPCGRVM